MHGQKKNKKSLLSDSGAFITTNPADAISTRIITQSTNSYVGLDDGLHLAIYKLFIYGGCLLCCVVGLHTLMNKLHSVGTTCIITVRSCRWPCKPAGGTCRHFTNVQTRGCALILRRSGALAQTNMPKYVQCTCFSQHLLCWHPVGLPVHLVPAIKLAGTRC